MKLFEFLAQMRKEKFPLRIDYREHIGCVDVEVETFSERWIFSFDEDGFVDFVIYKDINAPDKRKYAPVPFISFLLFLFLFLFVCPIFYDMKTAIE